MLEVPAGKTGSGRRTNCCGFERELKEETGYSAANIRLFDKNVPFCRVFRRASLSLSMYGVDKGETAFLTITRPSISKNTISTTYIRWL